MNAKQTETVFLDEYHGRPLVISPAAHQQIIAIVDANRVCKICAEPYTEQRPMVVLNICLHCFLHSELALREKRLSFVGEFGNDPLGRTDTLNTFVDADGYVFLLDNGMDYTRLDRDIYYTLKHWGFQVPDSITVEGSDRPLDRHSWTVYGDFTKLSVVVLRYAQGYGDHLEKLFFAYKSEALVEISRRKQYVRAMFAEAKQQLEATEDAEGRYHHPAGFTTYYIEESHLYPFIAKIASQLYDEAHSQETES